VYPYTHIEVYHEDTKIKRRDLLDLTGKIKFRENYDYKALREGK